MIRTIFCHSRRPSRSGILFDGVDQSRLPTERPAIGKFPDGCKLLWGRNFQSQPAIGSFRKTRTQAALPGYLGVAGHLLPRACYAPFARWQEIKSRGILWQSVFKSLVRSCWLGPARKNIVAREQFLASLAQILVCFFELGRIRDQGSIQLPAIRGYVRKTLPVPFARIGVEIRKR